MFSTLYILFIGRCSAIFTVSPPPFRIPAYIPSIPDASLLFIWLLLFLLHLLILLLLLFHLHLCLAFFLLNCVIGVCRVFFPSVLHVRSVHQRFPIFHILYWLFLFWTIHTCYKILCVKRKSWIASYRPASRCPVWMKFCRDTRSINTVDSRDI